MKEQTSWPPVFLLLRFYGNGGKQKSHKNACIGFVKFKKKTRRVCNVPYSMLVQKLRLDNREFCFR